MTQSIVCSCTPAENHDPGPAGSGLRHTLSRRLALARIGMASAAASVGVAADALARDADPHPAWWAEYEANMAFINDPQRWVDDPDETRADAVFERNLNLDDLIATTPARTLAGAVAQLALVTHMLEVVGSFNDQDVVALKSAAETVRRLAGGTAHG